MEQEIKRCPYCGEEILTVAKKCKHCGEWLDNADEQKKQMIACPVCGEMIEEDTEKCPYCHERLDVIIEQEPSRIGESEATMDNNIQDDSRSFFDYYLWDPFFRHYFDFKGRLNREHYWLSILVWTIALIALLVIVPVGVLFFLITIIPLYATTARRLRDAESFPTALMWSLIVSPLIMIWTCKPSEDESIRVDNLAPDTPQPVKFKKSDVITTLILILFFIFGPALNSSILDRIPTEGDDSELISTATMEDDTDNDILEIGEALEILNCVEGYEKVSNEAKSKIRELLIEQYQYERGADEFERQYGDIWVFYKNCVQKGEESPTPIDKNIASVVRLGVDAVCPPRVEITVFEEQQLDFLKQKLLKNGFTLTSSEDFGELYEKGYYKAQVSWYDEYKSGFVSIHKEIDTDNDDDESTNNSAEDVWLGELLDAGNSNIEDLVWKKRLISLVGQDNYNFMCEQYMGTAIQKEDGMMGRYQSYTFSGSTKENWDDGYVVSYSCGDGHENLEVEITRNGIAKTFQEDN